MKTLLFCLSVALLCVSLLFPAHSAGVDSLAVLAIVAGCISLALPAPTRIRHTGYRCGYKNAAISTVGTVVGIGTVALGPFTTINNITDIPDPAYTTSDLDVTNLASTKKEYVNGLGDSAVFKITGQRVATDAGQNLLRDHNGSATPLYFQVTFPDGEILVFAANIKSFSVTGGTDAVVMFNSSIRATGQPTWSGTGAPT